MSSVRRAGRRHVGELADGLGDPAPCRLAMVIVLGRQFVGARSAFLKGLRAVLLEHQGGGTPDVDLGYHVRNIAESGIKIAEKSLD
jgi:hypothetical protein